MKELLLIGADIEIIEEIEKSGEYFIIGIIDSRQITSYYGYKVLGNDKYLIENKNAFKHAYISITLDDVRIKEKLYRLYEKENFRFADIISKDACVSDKAKFGKGVIIMNGVNISANCSIGVCAKVNVNANLMHDGLFGDFCTFAPNILTLGYVKSGRNVFFGSNATILPRVIIGNNIIIGAGAVITNNLTDNAIYVGCPGHKIREL